MNETEAIINTQPQQQTIADYAAAYVERFGWSLLRIKPGEKRPVDANWSQALSVLIDTPDKAYALAGTNYGIGILHSASGTGTFDVDHLEHTRYLFGEFGIDFDALMSGFPRIKGKQGRDKILFRMPVALEKVALTWPSREGKARFNLFEFRAGHHQDLLPPSQHPDGHLYEWAVSPFDIDEIPECPKELLILWREWSRFKPQLEAICPWAEQPVYKAKVKTGQKKGLRVIDTFNDAHDLAASMDRYGYDRKGNNRWLYSGSSTRIPGASILKTDTGKEVLFSHHASDPMGDGYAHDAFDLFCYYEHGGNVNAAVQAAIDLLGLEDDVPAVDISAILKKKPTMVQPKVVVPEMRCQWPALINELHQWAEDTAHKKQPELSLNSVLAGFSALLGRRAKSNRRAWPALYFQNMALAGEGKEHGRTVATAMLQACGQEKRIGGGGFTSAGAVCSALLRSPGVLVVVDELGRKIASGKSDQSGNQQSAATEIMSIFGMAHSIYVPPQYSTMNLSDDQKKKRDEQRVLNPSLTLLNLSTPDTFYGAITSDFIADGFISRFLIVDSSHLPRQMGTFPEDKPIPELLKVWFDAFASRFDDMGDMARIENFTSENPLNAPAPVELDVSAGALRLLQSFEAEIMTVKNELDSEGLSECLARSVEKAGRLALIVALAADPLATQVDEYATQTAIEYVRHHDMRIVERVRANVSDSDFEKARNVAYKAILLKGEEGYKDRDMKRYVKGFKGLEPQKQNAVIRSLLDAGLIIRGTKPNARGPSTPFWIASQFVCVEGVDGDENA